MKNIIATHSLFVYSPNKQSYSKINKLKRLTNSNGGNNVRFISQSTGFGNQIKAVKELLHKPTVGQWIFCEINESSQIDLLEKLANNALFSFFNLSLMDDLGSLDYDSFNCKNKCSLVTENALIIGDIHEHLDPLKKLLQSKSECDIVLLGDYLDKGGNTLETVEYIYDLYKSGASIILGNHEHYVYRRLIGELKPTDFEKEVFTSVEPLLSSLSHREMFFELYNASLPFLNIKVGNLNYWATHAPCRVKHLGKQDETSLKKQRNFYFKDRNPAKVFEQLDFLRYPLPKNHFHIFGHVAHNTEELFINGRFWLDTGSVYGNKLSSLHLTLSGYSIVQESSLSEFQSHKLVDLAIHL